MNRRGAQLETETADMLAMAEQLDTNLTDLNKRIEGTNTGCSVSRYILAVLVDEKNMFN